MRENTNEVRGGIQISLAKLLQCYLRRLWLILLCTAVTGVGAYLYTQKMITPLYAAKATIYVSNLKNAESEQEFVSGSNISTAKMLVGTYMSVIQSDRVLTAVVEKSGVGYSADYVRALMLLAQEGDTEIFSVTVRHRDPQTAAEIANAVAEYAPAEIANIVEGSSAKTLDTAKVPTYPYYPNVQNNTSIGCVVGLLASLIFLTLQFLLDGRLKDAETLEQTFDLPVLGEIPDFRSQDNKKRGGANTRENTEKGAEKE